MTIARHSQRALRRGFTLIEALVVVVILGVLAAVIAPRILQRVGQSKQATAASNASALATALNNYILDHGEPADGATIDIVYDGGGNGGDNFTPYVQSTDALLDPWGNKYILVIPGQKNADFDIVSYGADGKPGGEGENADIVKP